MDRNTTASRVKAGAAAFVAAVAVAVPALDAGPADGAPAGAPPLTATAWGSSQQYTRQGTLCSGPYEGEVAPMRETLTVELSAPAAQDTSVDVSYGGTLVAGTDYRALPDPIEIPAGASSTTVEYEATRPGTVTLAIQPGEGYQVGETSSATSEVEVDVVDSRCEPEQTQTLRVGQAPAPLERPTDISDIQLIDSIVHTIGDLPPGIDVNGFVLQGAATTPGTYRFTIQFESGVIFLELPVEIVVLPASGGRPTPPAAGAAPVAARPSYTG